MWALIMVQQSLNPTSLACCLLQVLISSLLSITAAMARPLPSLALQNLSFLTLPAATVFFLIIAIFSIISLVSFLCASHRITKPHKLKEEGKGAAKSKLVRSLNSNISSKALLMVKMVSWRKVQVEGEDGEEGDYNSDGDDDEAVWKRTIMMGERCRPLDFSGKIAYDSQGNLLPNSPNKKHYSALVSLENS
ncbi:hypothetical protein CK203_079518 [Vitis vinifera]|uniref:Uncharacterized protein n=1 Tax=Vitis vinifera TaxID=29760 RepID=A0A438CNW9_VITVI|nr:hypothetical protein CK203_079518 [Vitis vinifera]